jgi:hypothetical protein
LVAQDQAINVKNKLSISGITEGKAMSLGTVEQEIFTGKYALLLYKFQVMEENFPIPVFFLDFKSIICN